jgi:hypothetical protein
LGGRREGGCTRLLFALWMRRCAVSQSMGHLPVKPSCWLHGRVFFCCSYLHLLRWQDWEAKNRGRRGHGVRELSLRFAKRERERRFSKQRGIKGPSMHWWLPHKARRNRFQAEVDCASPHVTSRPCQCRNVRRLRWRRESCLPTAAELVVSRLCCVRRWSPSHPATSNKNRPKWNFDICRKPSSRARYSPRCHHHQTPSRLPRPNHSTVATSTHGTRSRRATSEPKPAGRRDGASHGT